MPAAPEQIIIAPPQLSRSGGGAFAQPLAGSGRRLLAPPTADINLSIIPLPNQVNPVLPTSDVNMSLTAQSQPRCFETLSPSSETSHLICGNAARFSKAPICVFLAPRAQQALKKPHDHRVLNISDRDSNLAIASLVI